MARSASIDEVQRIIVETLAPYVGRTMAAASVKGYVGRLGAGVTSVDATQAAQLVGWIAPGLKVFVGDARAAAVVTELRAALTKLVDPQVPA